MDPLPHRALGIEIGNLAIEFPRDGDKIILTGKSGTDDHYTVSIGNDSGILDIHHTWRDESGKERQRTIFAIRREDIALLLREMIPLLRGLRRVIRRLRLGWLARHEIGILRGLDLVRTEDVSTVTRKNRRRRLVVDEEKWRSGLEVPEYLEEVWSFPDGAFSLFKGRQRIGIAFKVADKSGTASLYWIKLQDLSRLKNVMSKEVLDTAMRYAIPLERYGDYEMLVP